MDSLLKTVCYGSCLSKYGPTKQNKKIVKMMAACLVKGNIMEVYFKHKRTPVLFSTLATHSTNHKRKTYKKNFFSTDNILWLESTSFKIFLFHHHPTQHNSIGIFFVFLLWKLLQINHKVWWGFLFDDRWWWSAQWPILWMGLNGLCGENWSNKPNVKIWKLFSRECPNVWQRKGFCS